MDIDWAKYCNDIAFQGIVPECEAVGGCSVTYRYKDGDREVGVIQFGYYIPDDVIKVTNLYIDESFRGRGLGSHIVAVARYFYEKENIRYLQLRFVTNDEFVHPKGFDADKFYIVDQSDPDEIFCKWSKKILGDN